MNRVVCLSVVGVSLIALSAFLGCRGRAVQDLKSIRREARALVLIQAKLSWYSRTTGEESNIAETYIGHEKLFSLDNIRYLSRLLKKKMPPDSARAIRFLRDYLMTEYIGLDVAHFDDEVENAEANTKVKLDWLPDSTTYRNLPVLISGEKDPERRKAIFRAQARVWREVLNPILWKKEERVRALTRRLGYKDYVALSEEVRQVDLKKLVKLGDEFIKETDGLYRRLLREQTETVLGIPPEKMSRADLGLLSRAPYFAKFFPAELVVPFFREFVSGMGLELRTLAGTPVLIDDEPHPKKDPRAACYPIVVPRDIRITVKPTG